MMKNFKFIQKINTAPILKEIEEAGDLWMHARSEKNAVQRETRNICLRQILEEFAVHPSHWQRTRALPIVSRFRKTYTLLERIAIRLDGELSIVNIVALKPHGQVYKHTDHGDYYDVRNRYHLVIQSEGSIMKNAEEQVIFNKGELWWINHKVEHEAFNNSDKERIHIIFDLFPLHSTRFAMWKRALTYTLKIATLNS